MFQTKPSCSDFSFPSWEQSQANQKQWLLVKVKQVIVLGVLSFLFQIQIGYSQDLPSSIAKDELKQVARILQLTRNAAKAERTGRLDEANALYDQLSEVGQTVLDESDAASLIESNLIAKARLFDMQAKFDKANLARVQAKEKITERLGKSHPTVELLDLEIACSEHLIKASEKTQLVVAGALEKINNAKLLAEQRFTGSAIWTLKKVIPTLSHNLGEKSIITLRAKALKLRIENAASRSKKLTSDEDEFIKQFIDVMGSDNVETISLQLDIARLHYYSVDKNEGTQKILECCQKSIKSLGVRHGVTVSALKLVRQLMLIKGERHAYAPFVKANLEKIDFRFDSKKLQLIDSNRQLSLAYSFIGNNEVAANYSKKCLEQIGKREKLSHHDLEIKADCLLTIANNDSSKKQFKLAIEKYEQANRIFQALGLRRNYYYANFGLILLSAGEYQRAEEPLRIAVERNKRLRNPHTSAYVNYASVLLSLQKYDLALKEIDEAIIIKRRDSNVVGLATCFSKKGGILLAMGQLEKSFESYGLAFNLLEKQFGQFAYRLSEEEVVKSVGALQLIAHNMCDIAGKDQDRKAFEFIWRTKGVASESLATTARLLESFRGTNGTESGKQFRQLQRLYSRHIVALDRDLPPEIIAASKNEILTLKHSLIDQAIASAPDKLPSPTRTIKELDELISRLPAGMSVVEIVRGLSSTDVERKKNMATPNYYAYVISKTKTKKITLSKVDLGHAFEIDQCMGDLAGRLVLGDRGATPGVKPLNISLKQKRLLLKKVRNQTWDKWIPALKGNTKVLICSDEMFFRIPIGAALDKENRPMIQKYAVSEFNNAFEILQCLRRAALKKDFDNDSTLIIGGLSYGQHLNGNSNSPFNRSWQALPGAQSESENAQQIFSKTFAKKPTLVSGQDATEGEVLKQLSRANIVHLATHGFSLAAMIGDKDEDKPMDDHLMASPYNFGKPLFASSGVVVCAPSHKSRIESLDDGYITGEEIMATDLKNTSLVILSACNTGRGQKVPMEGVFSIDRSFRMAGARTTLSNLYPVSDKAAVKFTKYFYHYWLEKKLSKQEAFRQTQLKMIADKEPLSNWASWVLRGDWR